MSLAFNMIPFAGIAFLWFIGVLRAQLGSREDKLLAAVFLGCGLLFVAMLFAGAGVMGGVLVLEGIVASRTSETVRFAQEVMSVLLGTFGARMAAVFILSATTAAVRTATIPRWLAIIGYAAAVILLLIPPISGWSQLLFLGWVLLVSLYILASPGHGFTIRCDRSTAPEVERLGLPG